MKRAVKYCGGCNPRYDRVALVHSIEERLGQRFPGARPGETYDEIYVICGCSSRCADCSQLSAERFVIYDGTEPNN